MKVVFYIVFNFLTISLYCQHKDWHVDRKIAWSDFKLHRVESIKGDDGYDTVAQIYTGFVFSISVKGNFLAFEVLNRMYCNQSWAMPKSRTKEVLMHEQGHFDIREHYARILRKNVKEFRFIIDSVSQELDSIVDSIEIQLNQYQAYYDKETDYGNNREMQRLFSQKIDLMLNESVEFRILRIVNKIDSSPRVK
jgi:hypothetical protein